MNLGKQARVGFTMLIVISSLFVNVSNGAAEGVGEPERPCEVNFQSTALSVSKNFKYVEADYTFDENCHPVLVAIRRGNNLPEMDEPQQAVQSSATTVEANLSSLLGPLGDSTT